MIVFLAGGSGQLGWEIGRSLPPGVELIAPARDELDLTCSEAVRDSISDIQPSLIINASAYTDVERAESEIDAAYQINGKIPVELAQAAADLNCQFVHVSTDFVFDGEQGRPYQPTDQTNPLNEYGRSKLLGEQGILAVEEVQATIVRTAWLYSAHGNNFVKKMLGLMRDRSELRVVVDQIGTPTWAKGLADVVWSLALKGANGVFHWTDSGVASWYDFAVAIAEEAYDCGLLDTQVTVVPVHSSEYTVKAKRPSFSVLDTFDTTARSGIMGLHWRAALRNMLDEYKQLSAK